MAVLAGGRLTREDAYAYAKFARVALRTNDVDFRARAHSDEEAAFLASTVAGAGMAVTYADLEAAPAVLLVGLEPEEESPGIFLRLRKAADKHGTAVFSVAPVATRSLAKMSGVLVETAPGQEAAALDRLAGVGVGVGVGLAGRHRPGGRRLGDPGRRAAGEFAGRVQRCAAAG